MIISIESERETSVHANWWRYLDEKVDQDEMGVSVRD
jgi:hypothetical protein